MTHLVISPAAIDGLGTLVDDEGEMFVRIDLPDADGTDSVSLIFRRADFVTFADHLRMAADHLLSRRD